MDYEISRKIYELKSKLGRWVTFDIESAEEIKHAREAHLANAALIDDIYLKVVFRPKISLDWILADFLANYLFLSYFKDDPRIENFICKVYPHYLTRNQFQNNTSTESNIVYFFLCRAINDEDYTKAGEIYRTYKLLVTGKKPKRVLTEKGFRKFIVEKFS